MTFLFVSQMADAATRAARGMPNDAEIMPPVFAELGVRLVVVDATAEALPDPRGFDAVVVGGSLGSANDTEPWRRRLYEWLRVFPDDVPFFGICGGHQLYALARGGAVAPLGFVQAGTTTLCIGPVVEAHSEAVVQVPAGAEVLASDGAGVQMLRYSPTVLTTQFHPEFTPALARFVWSGMQGVAGADAVDEAVATGRRVLRGWIDEIRARRAA